ncbi:MAG: type II toxin-antitoxin system RelE/ParE family toxin [bacterium]
MRIEITSHARKNIDKLAAQTKKRCAEAIRVLVENPLRGEPLKGEFYGLRRYRVGNFRIVYEVNSENDLITIHAVKHRREVYR